MSRKPEREIVIQEIENDEEEDLLEKVSGLPNPLSRAVKVSKKHLYDFLWRCIGLYFLQALTVSVFSLIIQPFDDIYYFIYEKEYSWIASMLILGIMIIILVVSALYSKLFKWVKRMSAILYIIFTLGYMYCCGWVSYNYFDVFCMVMSYFTLGSLLLMCVVFRLQTFTRWGGTLLCGISLLIATPIIVLLYEQDGTMLAIAIAIGVLWCLLFPLYISVFIMTNKAMIVNSEYFLASLQLHFCWITVYHTIVGVIQALTQKDERDSDTTMDEGNKSL